MMDIEIVNEDELNDFARIDSILRRLIGSVEGTIPGSRSFGLINGAVNLTPEEARNTFAEELDEKASEYLPEIVIDNIEIRSAENGVMALIIYVGANEEEEDD